MHASKFTKFKFIVRDGRVFPGIWFDFVYPHNSSLFFATPTPTADKNKIYSPVLLWNKHLPTCIFTYSVIIRDMVGQTRSYYYTVRSNDVKVLKSRWNFVKINTTTRGNYIYTLLITFIAFHLFDLSFKLFISHTNSHNTLGPPVVFVSSVSPASR